jgi:hypothetical protein
MQLEQTPKMLRKAAAMRTYAERGLDGKPPGRMSDSEIDRFLADQCVSAADVMREGDFGISAPKPAPKPTVTTEPVSIIEAPKIQKTRKSPRHYLRDGELWTEHMGSHRAASNRVMWQGRQVASTVVRHYLLTGEWIKRSKPVESARIQAAVRVGCKVVHLGRFATREEAEEAKFRYRLGLFR